MQFLLFIGFPLLSPSYTVMVVYFQTCAGATRCFPLGDTVLKSDRVVEKRLMCLLSVRRHLFVSHEPVLACVSFPAQCVV